MFAANTNVTPGNPLTFCSSSSGTMPWQVSLVHGHLLLSMLGSPTQACQRWESPDFILSTTKPGGSYAAHHIPLTMGGLQKQRLFPGCQLEPVPAATSDVDNLTLPGGECHRPTFQHELSPGLSPKHQASSQAGRDSPRGCDGRLTG